MAAQPFDDSGNAAAECPGSCDNGFAVTGIACSVATAGMSLEAETLQVLVIERERYPPGRKAQRLHETREGRRAEVAAMLVRKREHLVMVDDPFPRRHFDVNLIRLVVILTEKIAQERSDVRLMFEHVPQDHDVRLSGKELAPVVVGNEA